MNLQELEQLKKNREMAESFYTVYKDRVDALGRSDLSSVEELVKHAKVLDEINEKIYLIEKNDMLVKEKTLKDEELRLKKLVDFIDTRIKERDNLLKEVLEYTGVTITDLKPVDERRNRDMYHQRRCLITKYFDNVASVNTISKEIIEDEEKLQVEVQEKQTNEKRNATLEEELLDSYKDIMSSLNLNGLDIIKLEKTVKEYGMLLDITNGTYEIRKQKNEQLPEGSRDIEKERELFDKVNDAKSEYYSHKEQLYFLQINELIKTKVNDYDSMYKKRENILSLLEERRQDRKKCSIKGPNSLALFSELVTRQMTIVMAQLRNKNQVDSLSADIQNKKDLIEKFKSENNSVEMLALLKEYNEVTVYDNNLDKPKLEIRDTIKSNLKPTSVIGKTNTIPIIEPTIQKPLHRGIDEEIIKSDVVPSGILIDKEKAKIMATKIAVALGCEFKPIVDVTEPKTKPQPAVKSVFEQYAQTKPVGIVSPLSEVKPVPKVEPKVDIPSNTNASTVQNALSGIHIPNITSLDEMVGDDNGN
ncbi:MAG: hypothetical protein Q4G04_05625 [bacterium]|nr:hypothetical protein [bacterium]